MKIGKIAVVFSAVALLATLARAQAPNDERGADDLRDAQAVARRHSADLMKIRHVRVVTAEIDARNDAVILVQVDDQKNVDAVTRQLPPQLEGFPVDVDSGDADESSAAPAMSTPMPPLVDENGIYHHTWLPPKPQAPQ